MLVGSTTIIAPWNFLRPCPHGPSKVARHLFSNASLSRCPPLQHNNNCLLVDSFNIMVLSFISLVLHCDCPSGLSLVMHCGCPSSLLSFIVNVLQRSILSFVPIVYHQDWRLLVHITHTECTSSSRSKINIYVHFHWVNEQLIGISFLKWNRQ